MDNKIIYVNATSTFWVKIESKYFKRAKGRDSRLKVLKTGILKNFGKFTGKHFCRNLYFNRVTGSQLLAVPD